jgi:hypothetical protein
MKNAEQRSTMQLGKPVGWCVLIAAVAAGVGIGFDKMENRVLSGSVGTPPREMRIALANRPSWIPDSLGEQIAAPLLPASARYYDEKLTDTVMQRAAANPWTRKVHRVEKRRSADPAVAIVEVHADYRIPLARIRTATGYAYVDTQGVRLPAGQVPQWAVKKEPAAGSSATAAFYLARGDAPGDSKVSRVHYIVIDGVSAVAPDVGEQWEGEDLAAGLRLLGMIAHKPYANQITTIDVRNFGGRISISEPHLRMYAQVARSQATDIRFGRFPFPGGDYVVSPQRKLSYVDEYVACNDGQLAGVNRYLDLRYDELHVSIN